MQIILYSLNAEFTIRFFVYLDFILIFKKEIVENNLTVIRIAKSNVFYPTKCDISTQTKNINIFLFFFF